MEILYLCESLTIGSIDRLGPSEEPFDLWTGPLSGPLTQGWTDVPTLVTLKTKEELYGVYQDEDPKFFLL